jgi:hypothetical protein
MCILQVCGGIAFSSQGKFCGRGKTRLMYSSLKFLSRNFQNKLYNPHWPCTIHSCTKQCSGFVWIRKYPPKAFRKLCVSAVLHQFLQLYNSYEIWDSCSNEHQDYYLLSYFALQYDTVVLLFDEDISHSLTQRQIAVVERSRARTVFASSNTAIVGSDPT